MGAANLSADALKVVPASEKVAVIRTRVYAHGKPIRPIDPLGAYDQTSLNYPPPLPEFQTNRLYDLHGISGSGILSYGGDVKKPLHFATIVSPVTGKELKLFLQMATTPGWFNRSWISYSGDRMLEAHWRETGLLTGRRSEAGKPGSGIGTNGMPGEMSALIEIVFPKQNEAFFVFAGYNTAGQLVPAFVIDSTPNQLAKRIESQRQ